MTEFKLVMIDRDTAGNILGERTITSPSVDDAFALAHVTSMPWDGHLLKDALRTETGAVMKTFCNLKIEAVFGQPDTPESEDFVEKGKLPVTCWKCKDREASR